LPRTRRQSAGRPRACLRLPQGVGVVDPPTPETERDSKLREACGHIRWMMELHVKDPSLQSEVETWLLETRRCGSSIWEIELHPDEWAKVAGSDPDFSRPVERRILNKLVRARLASQGEARHPPSFGRASGRAESS
jgi:hypothetical protein